MSTPSFDALVDIRCSVVVIRDGEILLLRRAEHPSHGAEGDWVLPGGRPFAQESMIACARREAAEETGLNVIIGRCLFVLEVSGNTDHRMVELVFGADLEHRSDEPRSLERGLHPQFVPVGDLAQLHVRPPIIGHLRGLRLRPDSGAAYLGDLWRPISDEKEAP